MRASRRVLVFLASVVAAACVGLSGCGTADTSSAVVTELPGLQGVGLHQIWQRQVRLESGERLLKVWRVGTSVYVATSESRFARLEASTGILKWTVGLGQENFDVFRPIELKGPDGNSNGQVLVVTRGEAFIFNMDTGDEMRRGSLGISVSTDPVVIGNTLCVGGADTFYGLYLDRLGMKHWRVPVPGDLFISAPVVYEDNVLVASRSGKLWRISADTGDWDWKDRKTNGDVLGGLAVDSIGLYVPCEDQRAYAFGTDTGAELWEQQLDGRLEEAPVPGGPVVMVVSVNQKMTALARRTGEIRWSKTGVLQVATVTDDTVWIGDTTGNVRMLSLANGEEKGAAPAAGIQFFVRNTMDPNVILVTHTGLVGMYSRSATDE